MERLYGYLAIGAIYALLSIRSFISDPEHPEEAEAISEIMRHRKRLSISVFIILTVGWLPIIAWLIYKISQDETT